MDTSIPQTAVMWDTLGSLKKTLIRSLFENIQTAKYFSLETGELHLLLLSSMQEKNTIHYFIQLRPVLKHPGERRETINNKRGDSDLYISSS